jgi:hypothetical protein
MACSAAALFAALLVMSARAAADTVIYYSPPDNTYGWAAGYGSSRAHDLARGYCIDAGGGACEAVVECGTGWGAIAVAQEPYAGVGAVCGINNADYARIWSLAHCMVAANTLCWTNTTFSGGGSQASEASNLGFDMTWYVQIMLQLRHYDPGSADGELGPRTREAISKFQSEQGLPVSGEPDDVTFRRLLDVVGGIGHFVDTINEDAVEGRSEQRDWGYAYASKVAPELSISGELMERPIEERLMALAAMLRDSDRDCSVPAKDAQLLDDGGGSGVWSIDCAEGSYTMILSADGSRMTMTGGATKVETSDTPADEEPEVKPAEESDEPVQAGNRRPKNN